MSRNPFLYALLLCATVITACHSTKPLTGNTQVNNPANVQAEAPAEKPEAIYNPSFHIINDIVSTKLEVSFDWEKQRMPGKATITFHPHFYPTDSLTLDAKGFDIHSIEIVTPAGNKPLLYTYDSMLLHIFLDRTYTRDENYTVLIDYTAKPNERATTGSAAITDTKGLYFINPKGEDPNKPKEIWTQGETEYNSAWYPTIDKPDMKTTMEIFMTVDKQYVTLSNGLMLDSKTNANGTRTDHWKLDQPIAPYLVMMAVGEFSVIKDKWRKIDVNYYVEPKYAQYAKEIFGDTPDMIEFYSKTLGVDFPWPKFSQVVVRDFVSGAMENVSAVVHYDELQETHRELIDVNHQDVICHELFHHWFGDLVTCESWANLPLNESFADFSESIWLGHKFGKDEGDFHILQNLNTYLAASKKEKVPLIRYGYTNKENMFDANSYQKGGCVLNMLRTYVGDEAFYKALNLYLTTNKYKTGEIHQLRLAFEEVTGEDLNWFFNQWFLDEGNPEVNINYTYDGSSNKETISIAQTQTITDNIPVFKLPLKVDLYFGNTIKHYTVVMDKQLQTFSFPAYSKPDLVNVDADKSMVWEKTDNKTDSAYLFQYYHSPLMADRLEAVLHFKDVNSPSSQQLLMAAMHDKFWRIRRQAINSIDPNRTSTVASIKPDLIALAQSDPQSNVRAAALKKLADLNDKSLITYFTAALKDSSYLVLGTALNAVAAIDADKAFDMAKQLQSEDEESITGAIATVFAHKGSGEQNSWFVSRLKSQEGVAKFSLYRHYGKYLINTDDSTRSTGLQFLYHAAKTDAPWWLRFGAFNAIESVKSSLDDKLKEQTNQLTGMDNTSAKYADTKKSINSITVKISEINSQISAIKTQETDKTLKGLYER